MKCIEGQNMDMRMTDHDPSMRGSPRRLLSLRLKLVLFISLIIIIACSGLSWYFIHQQAQTMTKALVGTGTILIKNLAHNSRYAAITEDRLELEQYIDGVMEGEEVVYVVMTGANGRVLARSTKGRMTDREGRTRSAEALLYPNE